MVAFEKAAVPYGVEMKIVILLLIGGMLTATASAGWDPQDDGESKGRYISVTAFDPARNPAQDLRDALAEAGRSGKRILLDVGGEWCSWCHRFDAFFEHNPRLLELRNKNFIMLKINVSPENSNKKFLSAYPSIPGYPHLLVLEANGKLLHSQGTSELELGNSYDLTKLKTFLNRWAPR